MIRFLLCIPLTVAFAAFGLSQVNVLNVNYDLQQTGANLQETGLTPQMDWRLFGKIGAFPVDGQVYAQPLYVSDVSIGGIQRDVVYIATMANSVFAFDAGAPQSSTPLWNVNLGAAVPSGLFNFTDVLPQVGILATPAIDPNAEVLYVVADTLAPSGSSSPMFQLHALSLVDGHEMFGGPVQIAASVPGTGADSAEGTISFDAFWQLQRPGLILANDALYIAFGSHADIGNYHGWIMRYDPSTLQLEAVFNSCPNGRQDAFWHSGRAPAVDTNGDVYAVTGNGDFDGSVNFGETLLRLSGDTLSLLDWYTPQDWSDLNDQDWDFGSAGAILIPGTNLVLAAGKSGLMYLAQKGSLGHLGPDTTSTVQGVQVNSWGAFQMVLWNNPQFLSTSSASSESSGENPHSVISAPAGSIVYEFDPSGALKAFEIVNNQLNATILSEFDVTDSSSYAGLSLSANGGQDGIVWLITGDPDIDGEPGTLHALDATNLANEFWNSNGNAPRDQPGSFTKFAPPTVANGRVYVPTLSNVVAIYGTLGSSQSVGSSVISSVVNSASYLAGPIAPGELITIFGANLGPPTPTSGVVVDGLVPNTLGGVQAFFNGHAAALLYVSPSQVNAVVPFELTGTMAQIQVSYQGQPVASAIAPIQAASPAVFSLNGFGGGQGAVLNQDGTVNSSTNPDTQGSVAVLYATGGGITSPLSIDGAITDLPYPLPVLPVSVTIAGIPAQVLYAGAAPGLITGALQINVVVPLNAPQEYYDQVVVTIGNYISPSAVTIAVQ